MTTAYRPGATPNPGGQDTPRETVLEVRNLRLGTLDGTEILHGIDFDLHRGETVVVLVPGLVAGEAPFVRRELD